MTNSVPHARLRVANIADFPSQWRWVLDRSPIAERIDPTFLSTAEAPALLARIPGGKSLRRSWVATSLALSARRRPFDVVVSHSPIVTARTSEMLEVTGLRTRHLAFSFNFTDLPGGWRRAVFARAFRRVDHIVVFTHAEAELYSRYFDVPEHKFLRTPWGVQKPATKDMPRVLEAPYFAALGGEARDYETLCAAARLRPHVQFVVIARPWNFDGVEVPSNVHTFFNLPSEEAWAIVQHSLAAIVPLRSRETPCGLVTVVGGMHHGKAQIVTEAAGVSEYIEHGQRGLTVTPNDPAALAAAIDRLAESPELVEYLGRNARRYAEEHCSETQTIEFVSRLLLDAPRRT